MHEQECKSLVSEKQPPLKNQNEPDPTEVAG